MSTKNWQWAAEQKKKKSKKKKKNTPQHRTSNNPASFSNFDRAHPSRVPALREFAAFLQSLFTHKEKQQRAHTGSKWCSS